MVLRWFWLVPEEGVLASKAHGSAKHVRSTGEMKKALNKSWQRRCQKVFTLCGANKPLYR